MSSSNQPEKDLKTTLQSANRSIVTHLLEKFQKVECGLDEIGEEETTKEETEDHSDVEEMAQDVNDASIAGVHLTNLFKWPVFLKARTFFIHLW